MIVLRCYTRYMYMYMYTLSWHKSGKQERWARVAAMVAVVGVVLAAML